MVKITLLAAGFIIGEHRLFASAVSFAFGLTVPSYLYLNGWQSARHSAEILCKSSDASCQALRAAARC